MLNANGDEAAGLINQATGVICNNGVFGSVFTQDGWPIGAVVFHNFNACEIQLSAVIRGTASVRDVRQLARGVFTTGVIQRVVCKVAEDDERAKKRLVSLGFEVEALSLDYFGAGKSALVFVLFRNKQRVVRLEPDASAIPPIDATAANEPRARYH